MNGQALIQVGSTYITHTHLTTYKNNLTTHSTAPLSNDSALLKEMATKELMLQLADEQGVAASLKDDLLHTALNEQRIIVLDPSIQLR